MNKNNEVDHFGPGLIKLVIKIGKRYYYEYRPMGILSLEGGGTARNKARPVNLS